jgi:hypothetical protein
MKYVLLITRGQWQDTAGPDEQGAIYDKIGQWWGQLASEGKMVGGHQLQPPGTATTVVIEEGRSVLLDRPLMEAKEAIGGYGILDAADLDEAVAIARTFPVPDGKIEVRPVVER